jgi:hypothetical protein
MSGTKSLARGWVYHTLWATVGSIFFGLLPAVPFVAINLEMMNRLKRTEAVIDALTKAPYSPLCLLSALIISIIVVRRKPGKEAAFVWVLPLVLLMYSILTWNRYPGQGDWWTDVWNNYFGKHCGSSECLYEFILTEPFVTSLVYTIGACFVLRRKRST